MLEHKYYVTVYWGWHFYIYYDKYSVGVQQNSPNEMLFGQLQWQNFFFQNQSADKEREQENVCEGRETEHPSVCQTMSLS